MIRSAGVDGGDAVELFGEEEGGEFVLEDEIGEGKDVVGSFAGGGEVSVRMADEVGDFFDVGPFLPRRHLVGKLAGRGDFASFVQNDAKGSFGGLQKALGDDFSGAIFEDFERKFPVALESAEIFLNAGLGEGEGGFADDDDAMSHLCGECRQISPFPRVRLSR